MMEFVLGICYCGYFWNLFLMCMIAFRPQLDSMLVNLWSYLQSSSALLPRLFRHDHWEWSLAVSAFFIWIHGFWLVDQFMIHTAKKGIRHPWRKYRLQVIVSMLKVLIGTL